MEQVRPFSGVVKPLCVFNGRKVRFELYHNPIAAAIDVIKLVAKNLPELGLDGSPYDYKLSRLGLPADVWQSGEDIVHLDDGACFAIVKNVNDG